MTDFIDKLKALPKSRRFWTAVVGVAIVALEEVLPFLTEEQVQQIAQLLMAWIIGDSLLKTGGGDVPRVR